MFVYASRIHFLFEINCSIPNQPSCNHFLEQALPDLLMSHRIPRSINDVDSNHPNPNAFDDRDKRAMGTEDDLRRYGQRKASNGIDLLRDGDKHVSTASSRVIADADNADMTDPQFCGNEFGRREMDASFFDKGIMSSEDENKQMEGQHSTSMTGKLATALSPPVSPFSVCPCLSVSVSLSGGDYHIYLTHL